MLSTVCYKLFVVFSSIILFIGSVAGEFTSPPFGVTYAREFKTVEIPWRFRYDDDIIKVNWFYKKPGSSEFKLVYLTDEKGKPRLKGVPDNQFTNRIQFKGNLDDKNAAIAIKDFSKRDEGDFKCQVDGLKSIMRIITIKVTVLSNVTEFKTVVDDEIVEGDNVTVSCTTTVGEPSPEIQIQQGDKLLKKSKASNTSETTLLYHFESISRESNGSYSCRVTTDGFISAKDLQLRVKYPPEIHGSVKSKQFGCIGRQMTIDCRASGDPKPVIHIIGPDGNRLGNKFTLAKFGIYRCEASSALGNDSLNITVEQSDKPEKSSFSECSFNQLSWPESSDKSVKYTLQVKAEGSKDAWGNITTTDAGYRPSTNKSLSAYKGYEFRVIATNCVGVTESSVCVVKGKKPSPEERSSDSSNAGVIAGSVIAVLVVILIIVIVAIYWRKRKRGTPSVRVKKQDQPNTAANATYTKNSNFQKPDRLLYSDSPNIDASHVRPPAEYRQEDDVDDEFGDDYDDERANAPVVSNNVPSWV